MVYLVCPAESQFGEDQLENLEVVVLFVAYDVDVGVEFVFRETAFCGAQVLGHVNGRAVGAQQELAVEPVGGEVAPYAAVGILDEDTHVQAFLHQFLAEQIGVVFVIRAVEGDAERLVGLVETFEYPAVHLLPELAYVRVAFFPLYQHLVYVVYDLGVLLFHFSIGHVAVAYEMVALDAGTLGRGSVEEFLPGIHRFADMHAAVVYEGGFDDLVAGRLEKVGYAGTQEVVADMAQVEGLVGVGRREFHHDATARRRELSEALVGVDFLQGLAPIDVAEAYVEKALDRIESADLGAVGGKPSAYGPGGCGRSLMRNLQQRKNDQGIVSLEVFAGYLNLHGSRVRLRSVQGLDSLCGLE